MTLSNAGEYKKEVKKFKSWSNFRFQEKNTNY
jgi:hypothetical protein